MYLHNKWGQGIVTKLNKTVARVVNLAFSQRVNASFRDIHDISYNCLEKSNNFSNETDKIGHVDELWIDLWLYYFPYIQMISAA